MRLACFPQLRRLRGVICAFVVVIFFAATNLHAAVVNAAVPDDPAAAPANPSSLALLATGLGLVLLVRHRYRLR